MCGSIRGSAFFVRSLGCAFFIMEEKHMKKVLSVILAILLLTGILLTGCSTETDPGASGGTQATGSGGGNGGGNGSGNNGNGNGNGADGTGSGGNATEGTEPTEPATSLPGSEGLKYSLNDDGQSYSVVGIGTCTDTDIVIPTTYEGLPVTCIGGSAFRGNKSLTSLTVQEGLIDINSNAFYGCTQLTQVTLSDTVEHIGEFTFCLCALTEIYIPASVTSIQRETFDYCNSITKIVVAPENPKYHVAGNCLIETETKMLLRGTVNSVIPTDGSVTWFGNYSFSGIKDLTKIIIPDCITVIGGQAFMGSGLTEIVIPDSVTLLANDAFWGCANLASVTLPNSITELNANIFRDCNSLKSIVIPEGVTTIFSAFADCMALESVTIPASIKMISSHAFQECNALTRIDFAGTVAQWEAIKKGDYWYTLNTGDYTVYCTDGEIHK